LDRFGNHVAEGNASATELRLKGCGDRQERRLLLHQVAAGVHQAAAGAGATARLVAAISSPWLSLRGRTGSFATSKTGRSCSR